MLQTEICCVNACFFVVRLSLLDEWRGLRDEPLIALSGIKGCIFVHASGFIGGNETREGVLNMVRRTLEETNRSNSAEKDVIQAESKQTGN